MDSNHDLSHILQVIQEKGNAAQKDKSNPRAQDELLTAARELVSTLESPVERLCRMVYLEPTLLGIVRAAIDWNLYPALASGNGSAKTAQALAKECGVEGRLMSRSLKHLAAGGVIKETDVNTYVPTPLAFLLCDLGAQGTVIDMAALPRIVSHFSYFLKDRNFRNPTDKDDSPWMYSYDTDLHYFKWIEQPGREDRHVAFGRHMSFKDMGKKWYDPSNTNVQEIFDHPTDPKAVLMVDVGGSIGHDLVGFHKQYPDVSGRLVLQDLPTQIEKIDRSTFPSSIEAMGHDFFTPEPIQGAKAYYLHMVLHDWPDVECEKILGNIIPAMKKGHSKILLNEIVIPDKGANWFGTSVDILMMMVHAAQERTETDWKNLVEKVGLKVTKIWDCGGDPQKILEVELA